MNSDSQWKLEAMFHGYSSKYIGYEWVKHVNYDLSSDSFKKESNSGPRYDSCYTKVKNMRE